MKIGHWAIVATFVAVSFGAGFFLIPRGETSSIPGVTPVEAAQPVATPIVLPVPPATFPNPTATRPRAQTQTSVRVQSRSVATPTPVARKPVQVAPHSYSNTITPEVTTPVPVHSPANIRPPHWAAPITTVTEQDISDSGSGEVRMIVIERRSLQLYAYDRAGHCLLQAPVALGKPDSANTTRIGEYGVSELYIDPIHRPSARVALDEGLPTGSIAPWRAFAVQTRAEGNPNGLGAAWIGLSGNGTSGLGIHGTNDPTSIGTFASDGCVRMRNADILKLVRRCQPRGTVVNIVETLETEKGDERE